MRASAEMDGPFRRNTVRTLAVRQSGGDPIVTRLRTEQRFAAVDLHIAGLSPSAVLCIRFLRDPHPGMITLGDPLFRLPQAWEEALRAAVEAKARRAARPWDGQMGGADEAVIFTDYSELLACLAMDLIAGRAASRWWWSTMLRSSPAPHAVAHAWIGAPAYVPAALGLLEGRAKVGAFLQSIVGDDARTISQIASRTANGAPVPTTLDGPGSPSNPTQDNPAPVDHSPDGRMVPPATGAPQPEESQGSAPAALATSRGAPGSILVGVPGRHKATVSVPADVNRAARAPADAAQYEPEAAVRRADADVEFSAVRHEALALRSTQPWRSLQKSAQEVRGQDAIPADPLRRESTSASEAELSHALPPIIDASLLPSFGAGAPEVSPPRHVEDTGALLPEPGHGRYETVASAAEPASRVASTGSSPIEGSLGLQSHPPRTTRPLHHRTAPVVTHLGGIFVLVNLGIHLELYGDFTTPLTPGIALPIWDFVALVGRELLSEPFEHDQVWQLLAELAGRAADEPPGHSFSPPRDGPVAPDGREVTEAEARDRWFEWLFADVRTQLARALRPAGVELGKMLCCIPARIYVTSAHLDVTMALADLPIEVRISGLDRDPGWVPAAERFVAFHFD